MSVHVSDGPIVHVKKEGEVGIPDNGVIEATTNGRETELVRGGPAAIDPGSTTTGRLVVRQRG